MLIKESQEKISMFVTWTLIKKKKKKEVDLQI